MPDDADKLEPDNSGIYTLAAARLRAEGADARTREVVARLARLAHERAADADRVHADRSLGTEAIYRAQSSTFALAASIIEREFPPATPPTKETEPAPATFVCSECGMEFDRYLQVREHMRIEHKEPATPPKETRKP